MIMVLSVSPKGEKLKKALTELGEDVVLISEMIRKEQIGRASCRERV